MWQFEGMKWPKLGSHYVMSGRFQWWLVTSCAMLPHVAPETVRDDMGWPRWAKRSPLWEPWISSPPLWTNQRREDLWRWSAKDDRQTIRIQYIYIYTTPLYSHIISYYHIWFIVYIVCILDDYYHNMGGSYIWMVGSHIWMVWLAQTNLLDPFVFFWWLHISSHRDLRPGKNAWWYDECPRNSGSLDHDARHDFHLFRGDGPIRSCHTFEKWHGTPTLKLKHRFEKYVWDDVGC